MLVLTVTCCLMYKELNCSNGNAVVPLNGCHCPHGHGLACASQQQPRDECYFSYAGCSGPERIQDQLMSDFTESYSKAYMGKQSNKQQSKPKENQRSLN